mmetsp:Transcript_32057/g.66933  ORF Transcript_32057/g.66933 Transcript_32057/m.66933 type:complete len:96 (+) Transcript_32057:165-452(+)
MLISFSKKTVMWRGSIFAYFSYFGSSSTPRFSLKFITAQDLKFAIGILNIPRITIGNPQRQGVTIKFTGRRIRFVRQHLMRHVITPKQEKTTSPR